MTVYSLEVEKNKTTNPKNKIKQYKKAICIQKNFICSAQFSLLI